MSDAYFEPFWAAQIELANPETDWKRHLALLETAVRGFRT